MSVRKMFWEDPYLTSVEACVTSVCGNTVTLDRTVAYAFSGGQASDSGTIGPGRIVEAQLDGGEIFYLLDDAFGLHVGDRVSVTIDWRRRYRLMRLHFAAEMILELICRRYAGARKIGANISEEKARVDFIWDGNIAGTFSFLEAKMREFVTSDLEIISGFDDERSERRFWEIRGFAKVPCCGTHIRRTGEIGEVSLRRGNIGKGKERIEITLCSS